MRVVISGGRDFTDRDVIFAWLDRFHAETPITAVIEGGQRKWDKKERRHIGGIDFFAHEWAKARGIEVITVEANWNDLSQGGQQRWYSNGRKIDLSAGPRRNAKMAREFGATKLLAFPGGRGTGSMIWEAKLAGLDILEITHDMLDEVRA